MVHFIFLVAILLSLPILNRNKNVPFYFLSFLILLVFLSIRYDYGNDYEAYRNIFYAIKNGQDAWGASDVGFRFFNLVMPNFEFLIIVHSIIYIYTIFELIRNNVSKNYIWLSITLLLVNPYLFLIHLSGIRQTIAICLFVLSVLLKQKNKTLLSFLLVLLAVTFHSSAIMLIPVYFLLNKKAFKKIWVFVIPIFTMILVSTPLLDLIVNLISEFLPSHYRIVYLSQNTGNSLSSLILSTILFIVILLNYGKLKDKDIILGKLGIISGVISVLTYKINMLTRVLSYFDIFLIILVPIFVANTKNKTYKIMIIIIFIGVYLLRYYSFFSSPLWIEHYSKYQTLFSY